MKKPTGWSIFAFVGQIEKLPEVRFLNGYTKVLWFVIKEH